MNGQTRLLAALGIAAYSMSFSTTTAWSRGLDQLQPSKSGSSNPSSPSKGEVPNVKTEKDPNAQATPAEVEAAVEAQKTDPADEEKTKPKISDRFFLGTGIAWTSLSADKGGWHAGYASDLVAGYLLTKMMQDRLWLYGTVRYLPIDVVVKHNAQEYRGIVESYLFGSLASYRQGKIAYQVGAEIGASAAKIYAMESYAKDKDLEQSGVNLTASAGLTWRVKDGVHLGTRLLLGAGTFTSIQAAANVSFSL
ncbi:MAG: hypothetical protein ACOH5I_05210 [Oligoflexus sp.]